MATWGNFDFQEFRNLANNVQRALDQNVVDQFMRDFLAEMAMRSLRKIKKRTPVGVYGGEVHFYTAAGKEVRFTPKKYKTGGQLRRAWQVGAVKKQGNSYIVEIFNNTFYAVYVEYGHRTGRGLTRWVEGKFMMTISMQEIERELPIHLERKQRQLLEKILNGNL